MAKPCALLWCGSPPDETNTRRSCSTTSFFKACGEQTRISLDRATPSALCNDAERVLTLDAALTKLAALDERKSRALEMRVFGGMKLQISQLPWKSLNQLSSATCVWLKHGCALKLEVELLLVDPLYQLQNRHIDATPFMYAALQNYRGKQK
jgi:hypothetical protein